MDRGDKVMDISKKIGHLFIQEKCVIAHSLDALLLTACLIGLEFQIEPEALQNALKRTYEGIR